VLILDTKTCLDKTLTLSAVCLGWTTNCQLAEVNSRQSVFRRFPETCTRIFDFVRRFVPPATERSARSTGEPRYRLWTERCGSVRAAGAATPDQRFGHGRHSPLAVGPCRPRSLVAFVCRPPPIAVTAAREPAAALSARPPSL